MGIKVVYRVCDINSTNPPPVYQDNRNALNHLCLESFVKAFEGEELDITFLLDHCVEGWEDYIGSHVPFTHNIIRSTKGIDESCREASRIAVEQDLDVLFQECDYLYRPNTGGSLIKAISHFGYVSPYDHLDKYPGEAKLDLFEGLHWRTATSTTQTYGITNKNLKDNIDIIQKWGYIDHQMWLDLNARGGELWTPIPSIATHMVEKYLAPNVDWMDMVK